MGLLNYYPDMTVAGGYGLLGPTVDLAQLVAQYRQARAALAQQSGDAQFSRGMQLANLAQDPYSPIAYLEAMAQSGSPIPLLGRGLTQLKPMIPRPAPSYGDQYVQDYLRYPATEPPDIARVRAAYAEDPARAAAFFGKPNPFAAGGTMMMDHPGVLVDATNGSPVATVSENGGEFIDGNRRGLRVRPQRGVSRRLDPNRQQQIVDMALGADGKYGMEDMHGASGGGNWIAGAIGNPGALHRQLGVPEGKKIPTDVLATAAHAPGKLGRRARLAKTLRGFPMGGDVKQGSDPFMPITGTPIARLGTPVSGPPDTLLPPSRTPVSGPPQPLLDPTGGTPREGTPLGPYAPTPGRAPAANLIGKPLIGSAMQRLYRKNPQLAMRMRGRPASAALLQYIFGPATGEFPGAAGGGAITSVATPGAGRIGGGTFTSAIEEAIKNADPAARRAAAARETTTWANVGPAGSAQRRQQQDLNAAANDEKLLALDKQRQAWAGGVAQRSAARTAAGRPPPNTPYRANADGSWTSVDGTQSGAGSGATSDTSQSLLAKELAQGLATVEGVPMAAIDMLNQGKVPSLNDLGGATVWARIPSRLKAIITGLIQSSGQGNATDIQDAIDRSSPASYF